MPVGVGEQDQHQPPPQQASNYVAVAVVTNKSTTSQHQQHFTLFRSAGGCRTTKSNSNNAQGLTEMGIYIKTATIINKRSQHAEAAVTGSITKHKLSQLKLAVPHTTTTMSNNNPSSLATAARNATSDRNNNFSPRAAQDHTTATTKYDPPC